MGQWHSRCLKQSGYQKVKGLQLQAVTTIFSVLSDNSKGLLKNPLYNVLNYANIPFLAHRAESPVQFSPMATPWVKSEIVLLFALIRAD
jgi:hypothetical protein